MLVCDTSTGRSIKKFKDTNGVIKCRKSKKDRYYNGQRKKGKRTNNYLQNNTQRPKD